MKKESEDGNIANLHLNFRSDRIKAKFHGSRLQSFLSLHCYKVYMRMGAEKGHFINQFMIEFTHRKNFQTMIIKKQYPKKE